MVPPNDNAGNTPLSPEEQNDLIPNLATQAELNEWERENILEARKWAFSEREVTLRDPLTDAYLRELHRRMFDQTWKWAGTYRKSEKNIGVLVHEIRDRLGALLGNGRYWIENETYEPDELALRVHHELTVIHPFPNGNGRHARLTADALIIHLGGPAFSWGQKDIFAVGAAREAYLDALHSADAGDVRPLLRFARS